MDYLKLFNTVDDANAAGAEGITSPFVTYTLEKDIVNLSGIEKSTQKYSFDEDGKITEEEK